MHINICIKKHIHFFKRATFSENQHIEEGKVGLTVSIFLYYYDYQVMTQLSNYVFHTRMNFVCFKTILCKCTIFEHLEIIRG